MGTKKRSVLGGARRKNGPGIHAGAPLRAVVHIDTATGAMGGEVWKLTLDCGHQAYRPKRDLSPQNIFEPLSRKLAPHRARCLFCPVKAPP